MRLDFASALGRHQDLLRSVWVSVVLWICPHTVREVGGACEGRGCVAHILVAVHQALLHHPELVAQLAELRLKRSVLLHDTVDLVIFSAELCDFALEVFNMFLRSLANGALRLSVVGPLAFERSGAEGTDFPSTCARFALLGGRRCGAIAATSDSGKAARSRRLRKRGSRCRVPGGD